MVKTGISKRKKKKQDKARVASRRGKSRKFSFGWFGSDKTTPKKKPQFKPAAASRGPRGGAGSGIQVPDWRPSVGFLKVVAVLCLLAAAGTGLFFLEKYYVRTVVPVAESQGPLELDGVPDWVSNELRLKIIALAGSGLSSFSLDTETARMVAQNLASFAWLESYRVQTTNRSIQISAEFRKPVVVVEMGSEKFYVDEELVVLDYIAMPKLPIVEAVGVQALTAPAAGESWQRDDLQAVVSLVGLLNKMDSIVAYERPLLGQIRAVDVSNYQGRRDPRQPHILLYTSDDTQIIWGAEPGSSQKYLEAREDEKLAMLYSFYEENGTLANRVKYIELRRPRKNIPQPLNGF